MHYEDRKVMSSPILLILSNVQAALRPLSAIIKKFKYDQIFITHYGNNSLQEKKLKECFDWNCKVERKTNLNYSSYSECVSSGMDWVFEHTDRVIIIGDDCLPSSAFFPFAEKMLDKYAENPDVMHISGSNPFGVTAPVLSNHFFSKIMLGGAWATWRDRWQKRHHSKNNEITAQISSAMTSDFNGDNVSQMFARELGKVRAYESTSWDFRWQYSILANNGFCVIPRVNLVQRMGSLEESSSFSRIAFPANAKAMKLPAGLTSSSELKFDVSWDTRLFRWVISGRRPPFLANELESSLSKIFEPESWMRVAVKKLLPPIALNIYHKLKRNPENELLINEESKDPTLRDDSFSMDVIGKPFRLVDRPSAQFAYKSIFTQGCYAYAAKSVDPLILDCGANIGLSVHFWKVLYPKARVIAFEADPEVYETLCDNCGELQEVELHCAACWTEEGILNFMPDGSDGGALQFDNQRRGIEVKAVPLKNYLNRPISMLKLDIEGAEIPVLESCEPYLGNVDNIFVEFHSYVGKSQDFHRLIRVLERSGFRWEIHSDIRNTRPFVETKPSYGHDQRLNVYAWRD